MINNLDFNITYTSTDSSRVCSIYNFPLPAIPTVMLKLPHVIAFFVLVLAPASGQDFNYPDFSNTANLNLGGDAIVTPSDDLQLADGIDSAGCAVHSIGTMDLTFLTQFDFTITSNAVLLPVGAN